MFLTRKLGRFAIMTTAAISLCSCNSESQKAPKKLEKKKKETVADANDSIREKAGQTEAASKQPQTKEKHISKAFCVVNAKGDSEVVGAVTFSETQGGVRIIGDIAGLTPGKHGFHIHEHGDCSAPDASSAGGHFNPTNKKHGGPDSSERHVGDLGNLEANADGMAHYDRIDKVISLNGKDSIIGKSIVIHADPDDLVTDPAGNSGKRIGCGVIVESEL